MDEATTIEDRRRMNLAQARNHTAQTNQTPDAGSVRTDKVAVAQWLLMFFGAGLAWLFGLLLDLIIPFITFLMNYLIVLALWMWAKSKGLRPPTFSTAVKGAAKTALKLAGPQGQAAAGAGNIAEAIPGSDLLYIALGGISPLIYLAALWWNNR